MNDRELRRPKLGFNAGAHREKSCFISAIIAVLVHHEHMRFVSLGHVESLLPIKVLQMRCHTKKVSNDAASFYRTGGLAPSATVLPQTAATEFIQYDARPTPSFRASLRKIPNLRNALSVFSVYAQTIAILASAVHFHHPATWVLAFLLMGRAHAQFASLMHESAHRLLFSHRAMNDFVGTWFLGFVGFTSTAAYRRVHMAHHRAEFGPEEPDLALYANYPISTASFRRKLTRDALGRTGVKLLRQQLRGLRSPEARIRRTQVKIFAVQLMLFAICTALGVPLLYPLMWLLPYLTVWRVINRLRSIAEHGGMTADTDKRRTTHSVHQHVLARFFLVPFNIGFHLAHHVDAGVPFRHLPEFHEELRRAQYVTNTSEFPHYRAMWRAAHELPLST